VAFFPVGAWHHCATPLLPPRFSRRYIPEQIGTLRAFRSSRAQFCPGVIWNGRTSTYHSTRSGISHTDTVFFNRTSFVIFKTVTSAALSGGSSSKKRNVRRANTSGKSLHKISATTSTGTFVLAVRGYLQLEFRRKNSRRRRAFEYCTDWVHKLTYQGD